MFTLFLVLLLADRSFGDFDPTAHQNWKLLDNELCGVSTSVRIIGGESARLGELPWIARVGYLIPGEKEITYRCGGSILNNRTILTAAHCVTNLPPGFKVAEIVVGELNDKTNPDCENGVCGEPIQKLKPLGSLFHSDYDRLPFQNDIALIRLTEDLKFNDYVRPICMIRGSLMKNDFVGKYVEVAGWGIKNIETDETSHVLLKVGLKVRENEVCKTSFQKLAPIGNNNQMCVGGVVGKDSCGGDSGGPLMLVAAENGPPHVYGIGIVSFGSQRCGATTTPGVYTRLTQFMEWILDNLKENKKNFKIP